MRTPGELRLEDVARDLRPRLLLERAVRAARLEPAVYEEVEADEGALTQAAVIVLVSGLALGLFSWNVKGEGTIADALKYSVASVFAWGGYAMSAFLVGTSYLRGRETKSDPSELARTLGFASVPGVILFIPMAALAPLWAIWYVMTTVVAVRAALDIGTGRAVVVAVLSELVLVVIQATLGQVLAAIL